MTRRIKPRRTTWETAGALLSFWAGILAGIVGTLLSASAWILGADQHPWVRGFGTALLVITIPLLIFAGYCMDWLERDSGRAFNSTPHRPTATQREPRS